MESVGRDIFSQYCGSKKIFGIWHQNTLAGVITVMPRFGSTCEVGYWVGRAFCGNGIATAAMQGIIDGSCVPILIAKAHLFNYASQRVLQKAGMRKTKYKDRFVWFRWES